MGQVFKKYWTSVSKKPKGFKFIKKNIYEYEVILIGPKTSTSVYKNEYYNFKEIIPTKYIVNKDSSRDIIIDEFYKSASKVTGIKLTKDNASLRTEYFRRDGDSFPFVYYIEFWDTNTAIEYLEKRELRERIKKINKLKKQCG